MGHAVQHFFANGGSQAIVVRVLGAGALAAAATLKETLPAGTDVLTLTANGKGAWANWNGSVGTYISADRAGTANPDDLFTLVVTYKTLDPKSNAPVQSAQESFLNLSMSPKHPRYVLNVVAASQLVVPSAARDAHLRRQGHFGRGCRGRQPAHDQGLGEDAADLGRLRPGGGHRPLRRRDDRRLQDAGADRDRAERRALERRPGRDRVAVGASKLTITSDNAGMDSAVVVTPAPSGDLSKDLKLGLAWGGAETSGSAALRPATTPPASTPPPAVSTQSLTGGSDGSPVGPNDVVPALGQRHLLARLALVPALQPPLPARPHLRRRRPDRRMRSPMPRGSARSSSSIARRAASRRFPPSLGSLPALGEHGAIYYPRLQAVEALAGGATRTLNLPPCGAVAGVMARIDASRGIWKAPAGREAGIVGVSGLTQSTDDNVSGELNPKGVNVLRAFPGAGMVVWGARTLKGDDTASSEFKYIPVRRLTDYIASSLYLGTQFAVFEPNDPDLWGQLRLAVGTFMRGLFRQGAFQQSPKRTESDSFFVDLRRDGQPAVRDRPRPGQRRGRLRAAQAGRVRRHHDHPDLPAGGVRWPSSPSTRRASTPTRRSCSA